MSTDYTVTLTAADGSSTVVKIIDSINPLPLSDTWEGDAGALGSPGGIASLGMLAAVLHTGPGAAGNVTLDGFKKDTQKRKGSGSKYNNMGTFPDGDLTWHCDDVD